MVLSIVLEKFLKILSKILLTIEVDIFPLNQTTIIKPSYHNDLNNITAYMNNNIMPCILLIINANRNI